jgi:rhodanese-related sulfurtransferase
MLKHVATLLLIFGPGLFQSVLAINATALEHVIESNQKITIIDIRPNSLYRKNHIQNAINIPASIIDRKRLPALGRVIVYGEGIDIELLEHAVASLNSKPGIQAELLEGGFSAWAARHTVVQRQRGLDSSQTKSVTYQELLKMSKRYDALVLVDLRMGEEQESLAEHFPNVRVYDPIDTIADDVTNVVVSSYILETIPKTNRKVLILIDDGNGFSERVSDKLHAAGTKRLAILVGGEQALRTRGVMTEVTRNTGG